MGVLFFSIHRREIFVTKAPSRLIYHYCGRTFIFVPVFHGLLTCIITIISLYKYIYCYFYFRFVSIIANRLSNRFIRNIRDDNLKTFSYFYNAQIYSLSRYIIYRNDKAIKLRSDSILLPFIQASNYFIWKITERTIVK